MTRDEILNMPAGREMDCEIAKHVLSKEPTLVKEIEGYLFGEKITLRGDFTVRREWVDAGDYTIPVDSGGTDRLPGYSTDIAAAWQVVENLKHKCFYFEIDKTQKYFCLFCDDLDYAVIADSAPLAICRAALLAVMENTK